MKQLLLIPWLLAGVLGQAAEVKLDEGSKQSAVVTIYRDGQPAQADVMEIRLAIHAEPLSADEALVDILLLRDPETGLFLWRFQGASAGDPGNMIQTLRADSAIFVQDGKLLEFRWMTPSLWIRRIAEKRSTMEDGLAGVLRTLEAYGTSASDIPAYQELSLAPPLDTFFLYKLGQDPSVTAHLREVTFHQGQWKIVLDGPNGDVASVLLNEKLEIIPAQ